MVVMNENIVFLNIVNREGQLTLKMNNIKNIYISKKHFMSCLY